jgi:hypothetical protein
MCALLSVTATSHCLQEKKKTAGGKAAAGKPQPVQAEEDAKSKPKSEGKKGGGKRASATVVPQPLDEEGKPIKTKNCETIETNEEERTRKRHRSKR